MSGPPRRFRRLRAVARWTVRVGFVLLALVLLAAGWILFSESGTRFAVEKGLDWYNPRIPGHIAIGRVEGTLPHHLILRDVRITDADDQPLVVADALDVTLWPELLLDGEVRAAIELTHAQIDLRDPGFADLAMPSEPTPPPPPGEPSTLKADVSLVLDDVTVVQHGPGAATPLVRGLDLSLAAQVEGEAVSAQITRLRGDAPIADVRVVATRLTATWAAPVVTLAALDVNTSVGWARGQDVRYDTVSQVAGGQIRAGLTAAGAARYLPPQVPDVPRLFLTFGGGIAGFEVRADVTSGPASASLRVHGALQPAPDVQLSATVRGAALRRIDPVLPGIAELKLDLAVSGPPTPLAELATIAPEAIRARFALRTRVARDPAGAGPFPVPLPARADVDFDGALTDLKLALTARAGPTLAARVDLAGAVAPAPDFRAKLDVTGVDAAWLQPQAQGAIGLKGDVTVQAPVTPLAELGAIPLEALIAQVDLHCVGCRLERTGDVALSVKGHLARGGARGDVDLNLLGVRVAASGQADALTAGTRFKGRWDIAVASLADVRRGLAGLVTLPPMAGRVTTTGRCAGVVAALDCDAELGLRGVRAVDVDLPRADAQLTLALKGKTPHFTVDLRARRLALSGVPATSDLRLQASGTPTAMQFALDVDRPAAERARVAGAVQLGRAVALQLDALEGRVQGVEFGLARPARIKLRPAGPEVDVRDLDLRVEGGAITADGVLRPRGDNDLRLDVEGIDLARAGRLVPALTATGRVAVHARLSGPGRAPVATLDVAAEALTWADTPLGDLSVAARYEADAATAAVRWAGGDDRRAAIDARIPVSVRLDGGAQWHANAPHAVSWEIAGLDTAWARALVPGIPATVDASLATTAEITGTIAAPQARLRVAGAVQHAEIGEAPYALELIADGSRQTLEFAANPPAGEPLTVALTAEAPLALLRDGAAKVEDIAFTAQVRAPRFQLAGLAPLLPPAIFDPRGRLEVFADASGTLGAPVLSGAVQVHDGAITITELNQRLKRIELAVTLADRTATLSTLTFRSGESGKGHATGQFELAEAGLNGQVDLDLKDLPLAAPGAPPLKLETAVAVVIEKTAVARPMIVGVTLRDTIVRVYGAPSAAPKAIPQSDAIVFLPESEAEVAAKAAPPAPAGPGMRLTVRFKDPVAVRGPMVDLAADGQIVVITGEAASQSGLITVVNGGTFELVGNRFVIDSGEVTLPDAVGGEPFVNIVANTETPEATVTATIRGPATAPVLLLSAQPPLPDYQVLTLLLTGSTEPDDAEESGVGDKAAALFASFSNPELERQMQDRFGIDRVRLGFGETTDEPIISVGKHISPRLYVETTYHHNAPVDENQREVSGRYSLSPRWTLETNYGDALVGGVDVFWRRAFGGSVPTPEVEPTPEAEPDAPEVPAAAPGG